MIRRLIVLTAALSIALLPAGDAGAQTWDATSFFAPRTADDLGVYATSSGDASALAIWRDADLPVTLRGGIGLVEGGTVRGLVGGQYHRAILPAAPLAVRLTAAAGLGLGDHLNLWVPVGVSAGRAFDVGSELMVMPYVHPRVGPSVGTNRRDEGLLAVVDIGADVVSARHGTVRFGLSFGDETVLGLGVSMMPSPALPFF